MLVPEERGAFFDIVVALVRRVVSGDVRTGYFGLSPITSGEEVCSLFAGLMAV
jgi:hypothetical protein